MFIVDVLSYVYRFIIEDGQYDSSEVEFYEKFSMKMDFLYYLKDCKSLNK